MSTDDTLPASYFDGIFAQDDDPWLLASSPYEAAKFARTLGVLADRRYATALEVGCAQGVLTERLASFCDALLAVDIAAKALEYARERCREWPQVRFQQIAFPSERPAISAPDLVVLSEVVYYWSDADILVAGEWLRANIAVGGRVVLVHWTGETDYPQTGDGAVTKLLALLGDIVEVELAERTEHYRLDLWTRR